MRSTDAYMYWQTHFHEFFNRKEIPLALVIINNQDTVTFSMYDTIRKQRKDYCIFSTLCTTASVLHKVTITRTLLKKKITK